MLNSEELDGLKKLEELSELEFFISTCISRHLSLSFWSSQTIAKVFTYHVRLLRINQGLLNFVYFTNTFEYYQYLGIG